jgi:hypothetical protein
MQRVRPSPQAIDGVQVGFSLLASLALPLIVAIACGAPVRRSAFEFRRSARPLATVRTPNAKRQTPTEAATSNAAAARCA